MSEPTGTAWADSLDETQRAVYAAITGGPRLAGRTLFEVAGPDGLLFGPFHEMVTHPAVGGPLQALGEALRYRSSLSAGAREIVILTVAAWLRSEYEWYAHSRVARYIGVPEHVVDDIRVGREPRELSCEERCASRLALAVLGRTWDGIPARDRLESSLGPDGPFEVVALVGYYSLLANALELLHPPTPPGMPTVFTDADAPTLSAPRPPLTTVPSGTPRWHSSGCVDGFR